MSTRVAAAFAALLAVATSGCSRGLTVLEVRPPSNVSGQSFANAAVEIHWEGVPGIDEYRIYWAPSDGVTSENYETLGGDVRESLGPTEYLNANPIDTVHSFVVTSVSDRRESEDSPRITLHPQFFPILPDLPSQTLTFPSGNNEQMGWSLAAGDVNCDLRDDLIVGGPGPDGSGESGNTSVHLGFGHVLPLQTEAAASTSHEESNGWGESVALGDVNGDGCADMIIGSPRENNARGLARAYRGSNNSLAIPILDEVGAVDGDRFGETVAVVGDIDGDGFAEIAVSNPGSTGEELIVYLGGSPPAGDSIFDTLAGQPFPISILSVGDVSGDDRDDIAIGMKGYDLNGEDRGEVIVLSYPAGAFQTIWSASGSANGDFFGASLLHLDIDADGDRDLIVGSPEAGSGGAFDLFPFDSDIGTFASTSQSRIASQTTDAAFAVALANAGDLNGDTFEDFFVAAPGANTVHLYGGSSNNVTERWSTTGASDERFGGAIASGDFDGDGIRDLAIGAALRDGIADTDSGAVDVFLTRQFTSPLPTAGEVVRGGVGDPLSPADAWFLDPATRRHWRCTWDPGDGSPATVLDHCTPETVNDFNHVYAEAGTYTLTLRVERMPLGDFGESATLVVIE